MKTLLKRLNLGILLVLIILMCNPGKIVAQVTDSQVLDQNISIYAEDEPLSNIIEKICSYLDLDYSYNSKII